MGCAWAALHVLAQTAHQPWAHLSSQHWLPHKWPVLSPCRPALNENQSTHSICSQIAQLQGTNQQIQAFATHKNYSDFFQEVLGLSLPLVVFLRCLQQLIPREREEREERPSTPAPCWKLYAATTEPQQLLNVFKLPCSSLKCLVLSFPCLGPFSRFPTVKLPWWSNVRVKESCTMCAVYTKWFPCISLHMELTTLPIRDLEKPSKAKNFKKKI